MAATQRGDTPNRSWSQRGTAWKVLKTYLYTSSVLFFVKDVSKKGKAVDIYYLLSASRAETHSPREVTIYSPLLHESSPLSVLLMTMFWLMKEAVRVRSSIVSSLGLSEVGYRRNAAM